LAIAAKPVGISDKPFCFNPLFFQEIRDGSQKVTLDDRQIELKDCQEELETLKAKMEKQMLSKERCMNLILQFQTKL